MSEVVVRCAFCGHPISVLPGLDGFVAKTVCGGCGSEYLTGSHFTAWTGSAPQEPNA